jgi:hypothetical protein
VYWLRRVLLWRGQEPLVNKLNFVFFTESASELYGQRMYIISWQIPIGIPQPEVSFVFSPGKHLGSVMKPLFYSCLYKWFSQFLRFCRVHLSCYLFIT